MHTVIGIYIEGCEHIPLTKIGGVIDSMLASSG